MRLLTPVRDLPTISRSSAWVTNSQKYFVSVVLLNLCCCFVFFVLFCFHSSLDIYNFSFCLRLSLSFFPLYFYLSLSLSLFPLKSTLNNTFLIKSSSIYANATLLTFYIKISYHCTFNGTYWHHTLFLSFIHHWYWNRDFAANWIIVSLGSEESRVLQ